MYQEFFEFEEMPFSLTPDTQFFVNQNSHKVALSTILVALKHCEGFVKIVGEVGTGKTLLSRMLMQCLRDNFITVYIPNPYLTPEELKFCVAEQINAQFDKQMAAHELVWAIENTLRTLEQQSQQVVVIIDEAQAMPRETIECLRLLTNLETEKRKLLQVVMLGQPELDVLLARADLRQLKQRIVFSEVLKPLNFNATRQYLKNRLESAHPSQPLALSALAYRLIYGASGGIPRLINILAHKSLICAYGRGHKRISSWHVARAIRDTGESKRLCRLLAKVFAIELLSPAWPRHVQKAH